MKSDSNRHLSPGPQPGEMKLLHLDAMEGETVIKPPNDEKGYWAGAPSIMLDYSSGLFILYYRLRSPEDRGYLGVVAESSNGKNFKSRWTVEKQQIGAHSLERGCLFAEDGKYKLYISYDPVRSPAFQDWQIDLIEAKTIEALDSKFRVPVLLPQGDEVASVKDPYVIRTNQEYNMYVSYHPRDGERSNTGIATSLDGVNFCWKGDVFPHNEKWNQGIGRITSILKGLNQYYIFYDYEKSMKFSGEEKSGIAISQDMKQFELSKNVTFRSPYGTHSMRYLTWLRHRNKLYCYYEFSRASGAHELRLNVLDLGNNDLTVV